MSEIEVRAKKIIAEQLVVDLDDVVDSASLIDDLGADSLDMVELVLKFENALALRFPMMRRNRF